MVPLSLEIVRKNRIGFYRSSRGWGNWGKTVKSQTWCGKCRTQEDVDEFYALHSFHSLFFYPQDKSCGIHRDMWTDFYSPRMLLCSFLMTSSVSLEFLRSSSILLQACMTVV